MDAGGKLQGGSRDGRTRLCLNMTSHVDRGPLVNMCREIGSSCLLPHKPAVQWSALLSDVLVRRAAHTRFRVQPLTSRASLAGKLSASDVF